MALNTPTTNTLWGGKGSLGASHTVSPRDRLVGDAQGWVTP